MCCSGIARRCTHEGDVGLSRLLIPRRLDVEVNHAQRFLEFSYKAFVRDGVVHCNTSRYEGSAPPFLRRVPLPRRVLCWLSS